MIFTKKKLLLSSLLGLAFIPATISIVGCSNNGVTFKQADEVIEYLNSNKKIHNDSQPADLLSYLWNRKNFTSQNIVNGQLVQFADPAQWDNSSHNMHQVIHYVKVDHLTSKTFKYSMSATLTIQSDSVTSVEKYKYIGNINWANDTSAINYSLSIYKDGILVPNMTQKFSITSFSGIDSQYNIECNYTNLIAGGTGTQTCFTIYPNEYPNINFQ